VAIHVRTCGPKNMTRGMRQRDFTNLEQGSKRAALVCKEETKLGVGVSGISVGKNCVNFVSDHTENSPSSFWIIFWLHNRVRCKAASESRARAFYCLIKRSRQIYTNFVIRKLHSLCAVYTRISSVLCNKTNFWYL
jgi:hypothetical protein